MTRDQAARIAEAELIWLEIDGELAYEDECRDWLQGRQDEVPDPALHGLSEEHGAKLAAAVVRADAERTAAWYDEAAAAYESVLKVA